MMIRNANALLLSLSRRRVSPPHIQERVRNPARTPTKDATVITSTSRCATWDNSCERTPSSSSASSRRSSPVVTQTTARFVLRPVANALGMSVSAMATAGLGMSAIAHSRSTMACSCGACSGVTTRADIENRATRSEKYHWAHAEPPARISTKYHLTPAKISTAIRAT